MSTPIWQAATVGQTGKAGHVNQLLGTHTSIVALTGSLRANVVTSGAVATSTNATWLAQSFATVAGQTTLGYVIVPIRTTSTNPTLLAPTTLSLYANSGGAPTGSALVTTTITLEYANVPSNLNTLAIIPLPITGLTASTTYWLVTPAAGNSTDHYNWFRSASTSGASTSTNGTTWTAQAYGFRYEVFDQLGGGINTATWEDAGARWTATTYNSTNQVLTYSEYTAGQTVSGYLQSIRTFTYSNGLLIGIA